MGVSAIIVNFNGQPYLDACIGSLIKQRELDEIIIVDNASQDRSMESIILKYQDQIMPIYAGSNLGYGAGANLGATIASGNVLLFLNPDVVIGDGCIEALARHLKASPGVSGPVLKISASDILEFGCTLNSMGMVKSLLSPGLPLFVSGSALAISSEIFHALGGFDERMFLFCEEAELCWRVLNAGFDVTVSVHALASHVGGSVIPGGYLTRKSYYSTSRMRIALRERNTMAMIIACALPMRAFLTIPMLLLRTVTLAFVSVVLLRDGQLAKELFAGIGWNVVNFPGSLRRRASVRPTKIQNQAVLRLTKEWIMLTTLLRYGIPRISDSQSTFVSEQ